MIKINLIQEAAREQNPKLGRVATLRLNNGIYALASVVVCFGIVSLLYWVWNHEISGLNQKIDVARIEAARLAGIEAQNRRYADELSQIENHIRVIQALEKNRTGPLDLMAKLGNAVDGIQGIYLLSVKSNGGQLVIDGQSGRVNAIADFISALQNDRSFQNVELHQLFEDDQNTQVSFKFDLVCLYTPPVETAASIPAVAPAADSRRPPGRQN
jgi:Tfp pilus assembly protein PilN